jgi:hypothetical protein
MRLLRLQSYMCDLHTNINRNNISVKLVPTYFTVVFLLYDALKPKQTELIGLNIFIFGVFIYITFY